MSLLFDLCVGPTSNIHEMGNRRFRFRFIKNNFYINKYSTWRDGTDGKVDAFGAGVKEVSGSNLCGGKNLMVPPVILMMT